MLLGPCTLAHIYKADANKSSHIVTVTLCLPRPTHRWLCLPPSQRLFQALSRRTAMSHHFRRRLSEDVLQTTLR